MTHKAKCIDNCMQYLEQLQLANIFSPSIFNHYYRKNKGNEGNAFFVGLNAADMMIHNFTPSTKILYDETGNEG